MLSVPSPVLPEPGRIFSPIEFSGRRVIAVAVSGGGDSLALLLLAKAFLDSRAAAPGLLALTVDHRLRPESAGEAAAVGVFCAEHGIDHRILAWKGEKPPGGLQAAAREARHALLCRAAAEAGTDIVLTGHTLDDQAETVAMRLARAHGRGEAGIAPATLAHGGVWFVRPLLGVRRAALRDYLRKQRVAWVDDPTNEDMRYERARMRAELTEEARCEAVERAGQAAGEREEAGRRAAALIDEMADSPVPGLVRLRRHFARPDEADATYMLRILLAVAGGRGQLADEARVAALVGRLATERRFRATLSRAVVDVRADAVYLHREARNLPVLVLGSDPLEWDRRYRIGATSPAGQGLTIEAAGPAARRVGSLPAHVAPGPVRAALAALPIVSGRGSGGPEGSSEDSIVWAGDHRDVSCLPLVAPWADFLPSFDLAPARAAATLVGAAKPPVPPLPGHNVTASV